MRHATAEVVSKFLEFQIFLMFGVPEVIVTDNGRQFESKLVKDVCEKYGVQHIFTPKYSPQSNASERVNRTLLAAIRSFIQDDQKLWDNNLNAITHALRNCVHDTTGFSPYYVIFGQHAILHGSTYKILEKLYQLTGNELYLNDKPENLNKVHAIVKSRLEKATQKYTSYKSRPRKIIDLSFGQHIHVRNFTHSKASDNYAAKLAPKYIPGQVIRAVGRVAYEVGDLQGKSLGVFHLKDIKI